MSSSILEQIRSNHEDIENYEHIIVETLNERPRNHRERILHGHKVSLLLNKVTDRSEKTSDLYKDEDGIFKEEMENIKGKGLFTSFYDQLKTIREYYRKYPHSNTLVSHQVDMEGIDSVDIHFSGEERYGKYLDLHEFYVRFLNLTIFKDLRREYGKTIEFLKVREKGLSSRKGESIKKVDYLKFLNIFHSFETLHDEKRIQEYFTRNGEVRNLTMNKTTMMIQKSAQETEDTYDHYLLDLLAYLRGFYQRTQPLVDLDEILDSAKYQFLKNWELSNVEEKLQSKAWLQKYLKKIDLTTLQLYLKCVHYMESQIKKLCEVLTEVIDSTKSYTELKLTRNYDELQAEMKEEETLHDVNIQDKGNEEEEDETIIYNPLNLPLGWDGKPIPYWLYKLHGLGVEYKCEICGNYSYWGRRAFDRHFQEWRHAHGMRCLRIPNTKHFHDITLMQDAILLYEKLKDQIDKEVWKAADEEEYEDSDGNVLNKKTYEDLARQGLL